MQFVGGNHLKLLHNGAEYFPSLVAAIDSASVEVLLESYIFADDKAGSLVADALARAAARGVSVRLLLDGFGARAFAPRFREMLEHAGAEVLVFGPQISPWTLRRARLRRMHRKLACVDGRVAFVGGINVIDDHNTPGQPAPRYDYAVRIEGPLTEEVQRGGGAVMAAGVVDDLGAPPTRTPGPDTEQPAGDAGRAPGNVRRTARGACGT